MTTPRDRRDAPSSSSTLWLMLLVVAVGVYFFGLGGQYVPTNGDELVYAHIARVTSATGNWLPLASELDNMRNTKPPLLFWQAMVATDWGRHWQLSALRLPSVIYTLLITVAIAGTVRRISQDASHGWIAACVYLAFFCTFRYGRPYLTSAPESFWLDLPMFALLWYLLPKHRATGAESNGTASTRIAGVVHTQSAFSPYVVFSIGTGLAFGLGATYKSFALIAPAAAALWCAILLGAPALNWRLLLRTTLCVGLSTVVGLGIFALWFLLDPDPAAVWREFVIGENAGKMMDKQGYWHEALHGGSSSLWAMLLAYVENAGLMAFVVLGLAGVGLSAFIQQFRQRSTLKPLPRHVWVLLAWLGVWLMVFSLPSQRSARYVIPAMPALAMLIALYWQQIARGWFLASMLLVGVATLALGRIGWVMHDLQIASLTAWMSALAVVLTTGAVTLAGALKPTWTRACTVAGCLLVFAGFGLTVAPLDGASGRYDSAANAGLSNARIAVPSNFNAQYERFQFLLPGNHFVPFDFDVMGTGPVALEKLQALLKSHDAVVWVQTDPAVRTAPCLPNCKILASRWVVKERHKSGEITWANLWLPHTWLFSREWLLTR